MTDSLSLREEEHSIKAEARRDKRVFKLHRAHPGSGVHRLPDALPRQDLSEIAGGDYLLKIKGKQPTSFSAFSKSKCQATLLFFLSNRGSLREGRQTRKRLKKTQYKSCPWHFSSLKAGVLRS